MLDTHSFAFAPKPPEEVFSDLSGKYSNHYLLEYVEFDIASSLRCLERNSQNEI